MEFEDKHLLLRYILLISLGVWGEKYQLLELAYIVS